MRTFSLVFLLCFATSCVHGQGSISVPMSGTGKIGPASGAVAPPCTINPPTIPGGTVGVAFTPVQLTASNCVPAITWALAAGSSLPSGLSLSSAGTISGTPTAPGTTSFTVSLVDHVGNAPTFPLTASITSNSVAGSPLPPDAALSTWDRTFAGTPTLNITDCVGTPVNASILPGGGCASNFAGSTAGLQAALNAVSCGHIINVAAMSGGVTIPYGAVALPNNKKCSNSQWIWLTGDLSDATFPAEGVRADPCYAGIPQTAIPWMPYPGADSTPNTCARHIPQFIATATANKAPITLSIPTSGTNTPSIGHWRLQRFECTRDQSSDALTVGCVSLDYQPGQNLTPVSSTMDCGYTGSGPSAIPSHPDLCAADQPDHIVISQIVSLSDPQRQTIRAIALGGGTFLAVEHSWLAESQDTFAGGQGDAQTFAGGFGHGYTGSGNWYFENNFSASSSEGSIFCGAFSEPLSPVTNKDGVPTSVIWNHDWFYKPITWDTQRGQSLNESLTNEGTTYPPQADQEIVWAATAFQVQQGLAFALNNTWLNDSAGGWNRYTELNGGSVTVDGTDYKTVVSTNGIVTKTNVTVGSVPWQEQNIIQWTYTACSGAGTPIAACTAATTPGAHHLVFDGLVLDGRYLSNGAVVLGNDRHLATTITATVTSGAPVNQIALSPSAPDLQIQPSYSDAYNNTRNFAYVFQAALNFSSVSLTWKVDGITNGNSTVGRICLATAIPCSAPGSNDSRVVYVSGSGTGPHTISVTSAAGTTTSQIINVSQLSPIWGYDLKAMTVKNMWEAKCVNRAIIENCLLENAWGSQGNSGGQNTAMLMQPANNANQITDGSGATTNYGPMNDSDVLADHLHILHSGGGLIIAGLSVAKGIHRIKWRHIFGEDVNCSRYSHGFKKPLFCTFEQFSGTTGNTYGPFNTPGILPWTSLATPLTNDINFTHFTWVGGNSSVFGTNSWLSVANQNVNTNVTPPTGSYQLGPFSITDSIFESPGVKPFYNNNGEAGDCGTNQVGKSEAVAFQGGGYTPPTPCFSTYSLARNLLLDSTAPANLFSTSTIWQKLPTDPDPLVNYRGDGNGGDYRIPFGSQYDTNGARAASDNTALGADIDGIIQSDAIVRWGSSSPMTISTASLPNATRNVAYSQTLTVTGGTGPYTWSSPAGMAQVGAVDILDYAMMPEPDRSNFCLNGANNPKCFKLDGGLMWWQKSFTGEPWDLEGVGPDYIDQVATENIWLNPQSYKMYQTPVSLWARYHFPGADDVVYTPGPNKYATTTNCGADNQPLIDNLGVRGELTGPFTDVPWHVQCLANGGTGTTCNIPDNTPYLLAQKWIKCTANDITKCTNEEDYWLVLGYGQAQWCPKTWNGSTYVTGTCTQTMQKVAHAAVTPNFACTVPRPAVTDGMPNGVQLTSQPPFTIVDSTGTVNGTATVAGTYKFTVQVEDSLGHMAQKTLSLTVQ